MLKSTHQAVAIPPLPPGWTEHKAPTGHSYYYNAETKQSTYTRPTPPPPPIAPLPLTPSQSFLAYTAVGNQPSAGTAFCGHQGSQGHDRGRAGFRGGRGGHDRPRERPQPTDKPISRRAIPGCENWELVYTKFGRRFVFNTEKNQSFWRIPDKLKNGILALDQLRIKEKANALAKGQEPVDTGEAPGAAGRPEAESVAPEAGKDGDDSSEYEEVEVTDDEDNEEDASERRRTEEINLDDPVEFNEEDIAFQLAAMGQEYGLDPAEYGEEDMADYEEGDAGLEVTHEDSAALFKDLLNDFGINPYSPWEKLVEEGKLVDDMRYTALTSMKARKEVWEEWSCERISHLRELRAKEEKKDPRIPYLAFLQRQANPKLYWPEFKRKYKKEPEMKDTTMADKEREKIYREHINRLKLPSSTLKSDLSTLLKSQPLSQLNRSTLTTHLPPAVSADVRYISLPPEIRDPLIEAYISTLAAAPDANEAEESEEALNRRREKERRQKALEERKERVAEEKRRQRRNLEFGKGRLREEEAEIERAMNVNKKGLAGHLMDVDGEK